MQSEGKHSATCGWNVEVEAGVGGKCKEHGLCCCLYFKSHAKVLLNQPSFLGFIQVGLATSEPQTTTFGDA